MALMGIALRAHPAGTLVGWQQLCDFVFQGLTRKGRPAAESGQRLVADAALLEGGSQRFAVELRMPAAAGNASDIDYLLDAVLLAWPVAASCRVTSLMLCTGCRPAYSSTVQKTGCSRYVGSLPLVRIISL